MKNRKWTVVLFAVATYATFHFALGPRWQHHGLVEHHACWHRGAGTNDLP